MTEWLIIVWQSVAAVAGLLSPFLPLITGVLGLVLGFIAALLILDWDISAELEELPLELTPYQQAFLVLFCKRSASQNIRLRYLREGPQGDNVYVSVVNVDGTDGPLEVLAGTPATMQAGGYKYTEAPIAPPVVLTASSAKFEFWADEEVPQHRPDWMPQCYPLGEADSTATAFGRHQAARMIWASMRTHGRPDIEGAV